MKQVTDQRPPSSMSGLDESAYREVQKQEKLHIASGPVVVACNESNLKDVGCTCNHDPFNCK